MESLTSLCSTYLSNTYVLVGAVLIGLVITAYVYVKFFSKPTIEVFEGQNETSQQVVSDEQEHYQEEVVQPLPDNSQQHEE